MPASADLPPTDVAEVLALLETMRILVSARLMRSPRDIPVLEALKAAGRRGMTQVQLAATLGIAPTRVSRLLDALEAEGVIGRQSHPLDRRSKVIQLTEPGQQRLAQFEKDNFQHYRDVFGGLPQGDISALRELLSRVLGALSRGPGLVR